MKTVFFTFLLFSTLIANGQIFTQNPSNGSIIITPKGVKGNADLNFRPDTTNTSLGANTLFFNTTGSFNTAIGYSSLWFNTTGQSNTAIGAETLKKNISSSNNTAIGAYTLRENTTGSDNTAIGWAALNANTTWRNTAIGSRALATNTTGGNNTAVGYNSLYLNKEGESNTATGSYALYNNGVGGSNTANGRDALYNNIRGQGNTAIGAGALRANRYGDGNVGIGNGAGATVYSGINNTFLGSYSIAFSDVSNSTAIGYGAELDASNKVRIGDKNVTVIEGQVAWSNPSDRRLKENILYTSRLGLEFINRLQTVSYNYLADKNKIRYDGFIAQDVELVMKELGAPFSGLKKSDDGKYSLAYSDFVMPLVNSVKELKQKNDRLEKRNEILEERITSLEELKKQNEVLAQRLNMLEELKVEINKLKSDNTSRSSERR